ncbi:MAG: polyphosphate polymerase domain-containing protein [Olsenella sp.]|nr:polyphosphate polymerase domain-containing protein [Olsenella sp.]
MNASMVAQPANVRVPAQVQMVFKRTEAKYLLTDEQRSRLERRMARQMEPDEFGPSTVRNLYLDTPTFLLARRSLDHPLYKEKVRVRSYRPAGPGDKVFLELKKKCEGVVYKRRCSRELGGALDLCACRRPPVGQVECEIAFTAQREGGLSPVAYVAYDREAYYAPRDRDLRMTFDRRVRARWEHLSLSLDTGEWVLGQGLNVLEVKTSGAMPLWLVSFLSEEGLRKITFSKYGMAYQWRFPRGFRPLHPSRSGCPWAMRPGSRSRRQRARA